MRPDTSHVGAKYQPEIDGLRALAVVPVMFFHAGFSGFSGGYLGVDVFFVISGYLITSIILTDHASGRFSIGRFYERRARRILPALFLVMATCVPFAALWMLPFELESFSQSLLSALFFVPNLYFWESINYFNPSSDRLPLLHTWSLGVEEQFYVFFPLMVAMAWRFGIRAVAGLTVIIALVSFGVAEWAWRSGRPSAAFFLTPPRAWELMVGCMLAISSRTAPLRDRLRPNISNALSALALIVLFVSIGVFDKTTPMPSIYGVVPILATASLIAFAGPGTIAYKLLANRLAVGIGLVSYSAYLWHQPLFAFARLRSNSELEVAVSCSLICLSFLLAYLTWRFIERPFRSRKAVPTLWLTRGVIASMLLLGSLSFVGVMSDGLEMRMSQEDKKLMAMADVSRQGRYVRSRFLKLRRDFTSKTNVKMLVIGDSFAQDFVNATLETHEPIEFEIRTASISRDCQIYFGPDSVDEHIEPRFRPTCGQQRSSDSLWTRIHDADIVILVGAWREWAVDLLPTTISTLALKPQQKVIVVGPKQFGDIDLRHLLSLNADARAGVRLEARQSAISVNDDLRRLLPPEIFVDVFAAVCDETKTCPVITGDGELISADGGHLTKAGARLVGSAIWSREPLATLLGTNADAVRDDIVQRY